MCVCVCVCVYDYVRVTNFILLLIRMSSNTDSFNTCIKFDEENWGTLNHYRLNITSLTQMQIHIKSKEKKTVHFIPTITSTTQNDEKLTYHFIY